MRNRLVLAAAAGATVLMAGAGLAVAAVPSPPAASLASVSQVTPTSTSSRTSTNAAGPTGTDDVSHSRGSEVTSEEAASIALAHVGGGRVTEIEREFEHGRREWKVEIVNGGREHDVRVDATTGAVTRTDVDRDDRGGRDDRGSDDRGGRDDRGDDRGHG